MTIQRYSNWAWNKISHTTSSNLRLKKDIRIKVYWHKKEQCMKENAVYNSFFMLYNKAMAAYGVSWKNNYNCYWVICDSATVKSSTWSNLEKNKTCHFCLWCLLSWNERAKTSNSIVDHFSFTSVNLLLAWMLYFHVWLQDTGIFLVLREYYN